MNLKLIVRDFLRTNNFQEFVNHRFKHPSKSIIDRRVFEYLTTKTGETYHVCEMITTVEAALEEYTFSDIRKDDIVIDIGACIGGFCIPAARYSDNVFAVEPLWGEELRKNIEINTSKIELIEAGLGNGKAYDVDYGGKSKTVRTMTFREIMNQCGGCDFLKCDAEGFEWFIEPADINGIRRLELEMHQFNPSGKKKAELIESIKREFDCKIKKIPFTHNAFGVISGKNRSC
jgi:hypothetical protein